MFPYTRSFVALLASACAVRPPIDWGPYDVLSDQPPLPPREVGGVPISDADYRQVLAWGEAWFRDGVIQSERATTDVAGVFLGTVDVPCPAPARADCRTEEPVLRYYVHALDALDGVSGNLFAGNGGPDGTGYTNDLVVSFPPGAVLHGAIPVPERLHTGLEVDAGAPWPIGLSAVWVDPQDADLSYLPEPSRLDVGPAPEGRVRFRLSCALCHYSLDIDADGVADLHSTRVDQPTRGSPYDPEDSWGVGNQDLHIGWLVALSANPILLSTVFSGPIGDPDPDAPTRWIRWLRDTYVADGEAAMREVAIGMILQPRGYADVTANGRFDTDQIMSLYTWHDWPSNSDGVFVDATDRNNIVWTSTLDFTGLVGTCAERAGSVQLPWERRSLYAALPCETFADMLVRYSPAARADPDAIAALVADILGTSDGVPGVVRPDDVYVISGSPAMPKEIYEHPENVAAGRQRTAEDYKGDAPWRKSQLALLGFRIRTPDRVREALDLDAWKARYPALDLDEFVNHSVNTMLDWMRPPPNVSALLANARDLVPEGRRVFEASGCVGCHRGPFGTDNRLHPISDDPAIEYGGPRAPTTAGWRVLERGSGPATDTQPEHAWDSRTLRRLASPPFDPATGEPFRQGGPIQGLLSVQAIGYKSTILLHVWASAPYLHDGGVGVGIPVEGEPPGDDLRALLGRAGAPDLLYGMGPILARREENPGRGPYPNAALSLQALLLAAERERVLAGNLEQVVPVAAGSRYRQDGDAAPRTRVAMAELGATGEGHPFWVGDTPGGPRITALVAYLLSLDDCPRELPGDPGAKACDAPPYLTR